MESSIIQMIIHGATSISFSRQSQQKIFISNSWLRLRRIITMSDDDDITNPHMMATLESLMRITLAGFGGALAGISISRRGGLGTAAQQALTKASATTPSSSSNVIKQSRQQRRQAIRSSPPVLRPTIDRELPSAWAVACMAFAGVVEFTRLVSPTTFVSQFIVTTPSLVEGEGDNEATENSKNILVNKEETIKQYGTTVIDYMIGGAIAGALFKGSAVRTPAGARVDASIMGSSSISTATSSSLNAIKSRPLSGILPGAALGLLAGVTIVTMEYAQKQVEEKFGEDVVVDEETDLNEENVPKSNKDDIPEDIKAMTTEELLASIQNLKSGRDEQSSNHQGKEAKGEPDTEQISINNVSTTGKAPNLLYSLGFRPHSSSSSSS